MNSRLRQTSRASRAVLVVLLMGSVFSEMSPCRAQDVCTLQLSSSAGGQITNPCEGEQQYPCGTTLWVTARPESGYYFLGWTGSAVTSGKVESVHSLRTRINLDDNYTLHARFGRGTIYVDDDAGDIQNGSQDHPFATIQAGVDYALEGDTIVILPGTYRGPENRNIDCDGLAVTLRSQDPNDPNVVASTIIDCEELGRAFNIRNVGEGSVILEGLTLLNGCHEVGGAVRCYYSNAIIKGCVMDGGKAEYGGAIYGNYSDLNIDSCQWSECYAEFGGAVYLSQSDVVLANGFMSKNVAISCGGGVYIAGGCNIDIMDCVISENEADDCGAGIASIRNRYGQSSIRNCFFDRNSASNLGGGIFCHNSNLVVTQCQLESNEAVHSGGGLYLEPITRQVQVSDCNMVSNTSYEGAGACFEVDAEGGLYLDGELSFVDNDWSVSGQGCVNAKSDTSIILNQAIATLESDLSGACVIDVGLNAELNLLEAAYVNLLDSDDPNQMGSIICKGLLRLTDQARLENANIQVTRASLEGQSVIANCPILAEAGAPYGQFSVEAGASIAVHEILAQGDRYLDMDPNGFDFNDIQVDRIEVTVDEGVGKPYGGLFECRGIDGLIDVMCEPDVFASQSWDLIPAFDLNSWTIDRMELVEGAKLNLTNRFDYHEPYDQGGAYEVLYVKDLILGPNSVLNTAYNKLYYENLEGDPNQIVNVPLLGYSLNNISFDDHDEYLTRVQHNGFVYAGDHVTVERLVGLAPDPNGLMRMCNQDDPDDDSDEVIPARAKALFAKSSEEYLTIRFEYLFENVDPNTELVIYLTDEPELVSSSQRDQSSHTIEVARLSPPPATRPGAVCSGRWGVFEQLVSRGDLNFYKGTRVEFELLGDAGTSILINNWDPAIYCNPMVCGDVTGDGGVTLMDYLTVISQFGAMVGVPEDSTQSTACLDGVFSDDGVIGTDDVTSWQWFLCNHQYVGNLCSQKPALGTSSDCTVASSEPRGFNTRQSQTTVSVDADFPGELLLLGKQADLSGAGTLIDKVYGLDVNEGQGTYVEPVWDANGGAVQLVHNPAEPDSVYQVHSESGLLRLPDGQVILGSRQYRLTQDPRYQGQAVLTVGLQSSTVGQVSGRPLLDAAFDDQGDLYVVPVVVNPVGEPAYAAAARLRCDPYSHDPCQVVEIYDAPPLDNDNQNRNYPRALELDAAGNVYVLHSHTLNEAFFITVFTPTGERLEISLGDQDSDLYIPAPSAFCASRLGPYLYLASGINDPEAIVDTLYVISTESRSLVEKITLENIGHITSVTENPQTGDLWVLGFTVGDIPDYLGWNNADFYEAYGAYVPFEGSGVIHAQPLSNFEIFNLGLPLSALWLAGE